MKSLAFVTISLFATPLAPGQDPSTPASKPADSFPGPRFATAVAGRLRGFADAAAPALRELRVGEPLVVVGKQGFLYEVEVPAGITAWVWSAYVRDGAEPGTVTTIEDGVNLRPEPESGARVVPIARATKGQTFTRIGRKGDWVQVVAPTEIHGYVLASEITITDDPPSTRSAEIAAAKSWMTQLKEDAIKAEAERKLIEEKRIAEEKKRREEQEIELAVRAKIREGLDLLRGAPEAEVRARAGALFTDAANMTKPLPQKTADVLFAEIQRGRERIDHLEFATREKADIEDRIRREKEEKLAAARDRQTRLEESYNKIKDPAPRDAFGARFAGMGWVRRELQLSSGRTYLIERGGKLQFYITCPSERYHLDDFVGREIGILGKIKNIEGYPARVIEIDQIEVLANNPG